MKVRRVKFDFEKKRVKHYFKGNIFSTHLVNSLHVIFPEGEKFFIRSCRKYLKQIDDKVLKKQVRDFMGQEGMHAVAHNEFWDIMEKQGLNLKPFVKFFNYTIFDGFENGVYKLLGEKNGSKLALSITSGLEHYTALLAEVVFENENEFDHAIDEMRHLLRWHAAEEIEHKNVAFDLLKYVDDGYMLRASGFTIATIILFSYALGGQMYFISQDEDKSLTSLPEEFVDFARSLGRPAVRKFIENTLDYFRKDFHPSQQKNMHYAEAYFAEHPERYAMG